MRSFSEVYPHLVNEWSPENTLGPDQVSYGSNKPIIWNGICMHTWIATPKNRGHDHGCPICSGNKILAGVNDFASTFPRIAKEWSDRNASTTPREYGAHSNKSVWWTCSTCGREWQARIADRTDGHGCPYCVKDKIADRIEKRTTATRLAKESRLRERQIAKSLKDDDFYLAVLSYYANQTGLQAFYDYDPDIGIPVKLYFPEKWAAIELTSYMNEGWTDWKYENAKNWLCLNSGITMLRIIPPKMKAFTNCKCVRLRGRTAEALTLALTGVFKKLKIPTDINISRDYEKIRRNEL